MIDPQIRDRNLSFRQTYAALAQKIFYPSTQPWLEILRLSPFLPPLRYQYNFPTQLWASLNLKVGSLLILMGFKIGFKILVCNRHLTLNYSQWACNFFFSRALYYMKTFSQKNIYKNGPKRGKQFLSYWITLLYKWLVGLNKTV